MNIYSSQVNKKFLKITVMPFMKFILRGYKTTTMFFRNITTSRLRQANET